MEKHIASISAAGDTNYYIFGAVAFCKTELPKLNMPLVIHVDHKNADLLDKLIKAENIDTKHIKIVQSGNNLNTFCAAWRFEPGYAKYTHTFDADTPISQMHLNCIEDFKNSTFDWYTCHLHQMWRRVMGGASGIIDTLLQVIYPALISIGINNQFKYSFEERALTKVLPVINTNGILYSIEDCKCNFKVPTVKIIENTNDISLMDNDLSRFNVLDNYLDGVYTIGAQQITVDNKPKHNK